MNPSHELVDGKSHPETSSAAVKKTTCVAKIKGALAAYKKAITEAASPSTEGDSTNANIETTDVTSSRMTDGEVMKLTQQRTASEGQQTSKTKPVNATSGPLKPSVPQTTAATTAMSPPSNQQPPRPRAPAISAYRLELRREVLRSNPDALALYQSLVGGGLVTSEEFWATRENLLEDAANR